MDAFDNSKKIVLSKLYKPDKSKKGNVDIDAIPIIDAFNDKLDYYTTSSCGGRINLFYEDDSRRKDKSGWHFAKHDVVASEEIYSALDTLPDCSVWFRQESPIFHVACRNDSAAKRLLELCRDLGFKHSGIIGKNNRRVMVEIVFNDKIDVPIASGGELFVDKRFVDFLVKTANDKFLRNKSLLKKFLKEIKKI